MSKYSEQMDGIFGALSDPTRRAIILRLCKGEASVGTLAQPFDIALPNFMKHIHTLEDCGIVETHKVGRVRTCRLQMSRLEAIDTWLAAQRDIWNSRLDRLEMHIENQQKKERSNATKKHK